MNQALPDTQGNYFALMRQAIADLSNESSYAQQIDAIAASVRCGQTIQAFVGLDILKQDINGFIAAACDVLSRNLESELKQTMEVIMLRRKIVEGARAYAAVTGDDDGGARMDYYLENDSSDLISTCIADLDPDRV